MTARVLIVDDDPAALDALQQMLLLRLPDAQVETCLSALGALARVTSHAFDVVLADVAMPDMDGLELLSCIRQRRPRTQTLLMTGHGDRALASRALGEGAYAYIEKPLDRDYLVQVISSAIERSPAPGGPEHEP
jgi:two-component system sensor histidine kinase/response regulator